MVSKSLKQSVKEAIKEIEYDKWHESVHDRIFAKLDRDVEPGKTGMCSCGVCGKVFTIRKPAYLLDYC